jgi:hypothetical protein
MFLILHLLYVGGYFNHVCAHMKLDYCGTIDCFNHIHFHDMLYILCKILNWIPRTFGFPQNVVTGSHRNNGIVVVVVVIVVQN